MRYIGIAAWALFVGIAFAGFNFILVIILIAVVGYIIGTCVGEYKNKKMRDKYRNGKNE